MISYQGLSVQLLNKWSILFWPIQYPFIQLSLWADKWWQRDQLEDLEIVSLKIWPKLEVFKKRFSFFKRKLTEYLHDFNFVPRAVKRKIASQYLKFRSLKKQSEITSSWSKTNWVDFFFPLKCMQMQKKRKISIKKVRWLLDGHVG